MNNLPLQPLKWFEGMEHLTAISPLHTYTIFRDGGKLGVQYQPHDRAAKQATGFNNYAECEVWAWNHYNEKMQPYVKPMPTWIDVNERLPDKSGRYMVVHQTIKPVNNKSTPVDIDSYDENEKAWNFFRSGIMQEVTHWMPIPEFSTMQNNKGG